MEATRLARGNPPKWVPGFLIPANILVVGSPSSVPRAPGSPHLNASSCYRGFGPLVQGGYLWLLKIDYTQKRSQQCNPCLRALTLSSLIRDKVQGQIFLEVLRKIERERE